MKKETKIDSFSKPNDIEDIEVVIGDNSILNISDVKDYINSVKQPKDDSQKNSSIIIPKEKLKSSSKEDNTAGIIRIPKALKSIKKKKVVNSKDEDSDKKIKVKSHKKHKIDPETGLPIKKKKKKKHLDSDIEIKKKKHTDKQS